MRKLPVILYRENWPEKVPFLEKNGLHVRSMKFDSCLFPNIAEIGRIVKLAPHIEELTIADCKETNDLEFDDDGDVNKLEEGGDAYEPLNLKTLKVLTMSSVSQVMTKRLISILRLCTSITKFEVDSYYHSGVDDENFLSQQSNLREIRLTGNGITEYFFTETLAKNEKLELKTLFLGSSLIYNDRISQFLRIQADNITQLDLQTYNTDFHFYRIIFNNFTNLRKLKLRVDNIIDDIRVDEMRNWQLPSVVEFETVYDVEDASVLCAIIGALPNLEVLTMCMTHIPMHVIFEKLPKLRKLVSRYFKIELMLFAQSTSLKELDVEYKCPMQLSFLWKRLAEDCPNIERITIRRFGFRQLSKTIKAEIDIILKNMENFKNMKYFMIESHAAEDPVHVSRDHDNPEMNHARDLQNLNFMLVIRQNAKQEFILEMSKYFFDNHLESMK